MKTHSSIELSKAAGNRIGELLEEYKGAPVLLMLSGGSALQVLDNISLCALSDNLTIAVIDERAGVEPQDSNTYLLQQTEWFKHAVNNGAKFIDIVHDNILVDGVNVIALLGIGGDGHTAGILPMPGDKDKFNKLFINTTDSVVRYQIADTDNPFKDRITVTADFLKTHVDNAVVYAVGDTKCPVLDTLGDNIQTHIKPANIIANIKQIDIYTDCNA